MTGPVINMVRTSVELKLADAAHTVARLREALTTAELRVAELQTQKGQLDRMYAQPAAAVGVEHHPIGH